VRIPELSKLPRYVAIYSASGQRVDLVLLDHSVDELKLDVRSWSEGVYHILMMDAAGRRMAEGSVVIVQ